MTTTADPLRFAVVRSDIPAVARVIAMRLGLMKEHPKRLRAGES